MTFEHVREARQSEARREGQIACGMTTHLPSTSGSHPERSPQRPLKQEGRQYQCVVYALSSPKPKDCPSARSGQSPPRWPLPPRQATRHPDHGCCWWQFQTWRLKFKQRTCNIERRNCITDLGKCRPSNETSVLGVGRPLVPCPPLFVENMSMAIAKEKVIKAKRHVKGFQSPSTSLTQINTSAKTPTLAAAAPRHICGIGNMHARIFFQRALGKTSKCCQLLKKLYGLV